MIDTVKARPSISDILTVSDFSDVFLEELPGFPPHREIEFSIDVVPGATPTSITPYRMAPLELNELKLQLQELLEKKKKKKRVYSTKCITVGSSCAFC